MTHSKPIKATIEKKRALNPDSALEIYSTLFYLHLKHLLPF